MIITKLFICEKPDQGKNLAKAFDWNGVHKGTYIQNGTEYITWAIGHLLSQAPPKAYEPKIQDGWDLSLLPIIPEKWILDEPDANNPKTEGKNKLLHSIGTLISHAQDIVIATDFDREGETIAWEMMHKFNYKGTASRMIFSALDKKTLVNSYQNRVDSKETYGYYLAGLGRMRADWLLGMNVTIGLTASNNKFLFRGDVLSAGRVQSPIVHLVVERELEIKNFKPVDFYDIHGIFITKKNETYTGKLKIPNDFLNDDNLLTSKDHLKTITNDVAGKDAFIESYNIENKETSAPICYNLDSLQKECNVKFGFSLAETLEFAQVLYEKYKLTSYPRTDSGYMPLSQLKDAKSIFGSISKNMNNQEFDNIISLANPTFKSQVWDDKKIEAHHAIIPIDNNFDVSLLKPNELKVYDLICRRYLMQFLGNYKYEATKVKTNVNDYIFETNGNVPKVQGWKLALIGGDQSFNDNKEDEQTLPSMNQSDVVKNKEIKTTSKKTKPPAYYTDASLLEDMINVAKFIKNPKLKKIIKKGGIGTTATRAAHLDNLFLKKMLKRDGKKIRATDKAFALDKIMPQEMKEPETTAYWEEALNMICDGTLTLEKFMAQQKNVVNRIIDKIKNQECQLSEPVSGSAGKIYKCDKCGSLTQQITSNKTGIMYWVCSNKDTCNAFYEDSRGKRGDLIVRSEQPEQPKVDIICFKCNKSKMLLRKSKKENLFWVCSDDTCKTFAMNVDGKPVADIVDVCHKCNKNTLVRRKKKNSDEHFWVCSGCNTFAKDVNGKPVADLTATCVACKGDMVQREKKSDQTKFWVCQKCKTFADDDNGKPLFKTIIKETSKYCCINCKVGKFIKKTGAKGDFWSCNNYPTCKTTVKDLNGKPEKFK